MFDIDVAIKNEDADILNRGNFAEKLAKSIIDYSEPYPLTIGLNGSWGSGKTSIINLTLNYIKKVNEGDNYVIVHFNPWFFSNQKNLFLQFFKQIINALKNKENENASPVKRATNPKRTIFKNSEIEALEEYSNYIRFNLDETLENNYSNTTNIEITDTLGFYKDQCDKYFEKSNFKVLVVIDDIERLIDSEINQIFLLVKSLANFKNFIYLLSFDKNIVARSLDNLNSETGDKFIDKIIQIPILIPALNESKLNELIQKNLEPIYSDYFKDDFINNYNRLIDVSNFLNLFINDIRDLKRFTNLLNFYWTIFVEELNINDFILMLAIQLFDYDLFLKIKKNKDILTVNKVLFEKNDSTIETESLKVLEEFKKNHVSQDLNKLLSFLFPVLEDYSNVDYENWDSKLRVCSNNHFDKYFLLSLENNEASELVLNKLLKMDNEIEIYNVFTQEDNVDYNHSLIYKFLKLIPEIPKENCKFFTKALLKCCDGMNLYPDTRRFVPIIIKKLLRRMENEEVCFEILKESATYENNLFTHSQFIYSHSKLNNKILSDRHAEELEKLTIEKINNASQEESFLELTSLGEMLLIWERLENGVKVRNYILNNVKSDTEKLHFISKFQTKRNAEFYFDFEKLDKYHGLDDYKNCISSIVEYQNISQATEEFCEIFLKQLNHHIDSTKKFI